MATETVHITNHSMDLSACTDYWGFNEKYNCWCLEDIIYTDKATTPEFQRLSIFVPKDYMQRPGIVDWDARIAEYSAETVPVIFENNSAGYMQMPNTRLDGPRCYAKSYLEHGFIYVTCGNRGSESRDVNENLCGKAPANLVDLKTAIRFLRHNKNALPGNYDRIISIGWSAGGAMSMLLGVTGDNIRYERLLQENGAFMDESDSVYAAQCYCPIVDLEHADQAYEWMFHEDKQSEDSPAGPAEVMNDFKDALSLRLKEQYIDYFNRLELKDDRTGSVLVLNPDGRSGSGYEYLMNKLNEAATEFLHKLDDGGCERAGKAYHYTAEQYLDGNDIDEADMMKSTAERTNRKSWISYDGNKAVIKDLDTYLLHHRRRMKGCTSFDLLSMQSGENRVFGSIEENYKHFNGKIADAIYSLREMFPDEYAKYYHAYADVKEDEEQRNQIYLTNPMNFIGTKEKSCQAAFFRIRVGAQDADTSFTISMAAALKLAEAGLPVDYALVWDMPHSEADYDGACIAWIDSICE